MPARRHTSLLQVVAEAAPARSPCRPSLPARNSPRPQRCDAPRPSAARNSPREPQRCARTRQTRVGRDTCRSLPPAEELDQAAHFGQQLMRQVGHELFSRRPFAANSPCVPLLSWIGASDGRGTHSPDGRGTLASWSGKWSGKTNPKEERMGQAGGRAAAPPLRGDGHEATDTRPPAATSAPGGGARERDVRHATGAAAAARGAGGPSPPSPAKPAPSLLILQGSTLLPF